MNNLMRKVLSRRSVYNFSANLPKDEDLMAVLEEGKLLSNAEVNQVWHFTAVQNRDIIKKMHELSYRIIENSDEKVNVKSMRSGADLMLNMPMLLVISGCDVKYAEDAADTLFGSMMLAAEKHGLSSCWLSDASELVSGNGEELRAMLKIPEDYRPLCLGAFGYKQVRTEAKLTKVDSIINIIR